VETWFVVDQRFRWLRTPSRWNLVDEYSLLVQMGGCPQESGSCTASTCSGFEVDLIDFQPMLDAVPGRVYGDNILDRAMFNGNDRCGQLMAQVFSIIRVHGPRNRFCAFPSFKRKKLDFIATIVSVLRCVPIRNFSGKNPCRGSKRFSPAFLLYWHLPSRRFGHLVDMYGYNPHCKWADGPVATSSEYLEIPFRRECLCVHLCS
jgi:hypothetical protein